MIFFEDIKKQVKQDKLFLIAYYGASTTSSEYSFPNWGEIIRYALKDCLEEQIGKYERAYWNLQTMNMGLNGALSEDLLERFDDFVLNKNPDMVFLDASKNDAYHNIDKKITEKNNKELIKKALDRDIKIVFTTRIPSLRKDLNNKIIAYVEIDRKCAEYFSNNRNFIFVDLFKLYPKDLIEKSYSLIGEKNESIGMKEGEIDPIHYNRFGNAMVAKILLKEVFGIDFNEERFLKDITDLTKKYPDY